MSETTTVHVIGKCPVKGCKTRKRHSFPGRVIRNRYGVRTEWGMPTEWGIQHPAPRHAGASWNRPSGYPVKHDSDRIWLEAVYSHGWVCEEHDRFCKIAVVKGVVNEQKTCNARCEAATGPNCECSCGGELHGSAHA